ncbi:lysylphosphatidylglycerol synthase domain-containing protein [Nonomuraea sediminis]|uniref:lysylphosphatidylglycerol synthase domain-containing protein n=1 Tax=Nonomuraea sediminis TaxID=2835864 RepID=UPI001BDD7867|nr:lysylphosphatidylglycerol synthase domain-containing protein [Nonomuraea sediminis]
MAIEAKAGRKIALSVISLALAALLISFLPRIAGITWGQLYGRLAQVGWGTMTALAALWVAGLAAYTFVLSGSLPGLSKRRALLVNCVGSGVSNVLPFGGAVGVAMTFAMTTSWGFKRQPVVVSTVVTGVWNMLTRFLLPAVGLACLLGAGRVPDHRLAVAAGTGGTLLVAIAAALSAALYKESFADLLGRGLDRVAGLLPLKRRPQLRQSLLDLRHSIIDIARTRWPRLTLGMLAYMGLQGVLFVACLHATGSQIAIPEAIAAFAINRVLTTAVITPGGSGISESATVLALIGFGVAPAAATASVLLFWFFAHLIEIPVGWLAWTTWSLTARRTEAA